MAKQTMRFDVYPQRSRGTVSVWESAGASCNEDGDQLDVNALTINSIEKKKKGSADTNTRSHDLVD